MVTPGKACGNAAGTADRIDKLAAKSGLSKTAFQEWDYVMGQNGMSIEKMQTGMKTLVQQMDGVQDGSKKSIEMFDALGVSVQNSDGSLRSQEEVMEETIMALPQGCLKVLKRLVLRLNYSVNPELKWLRCLLLAKMESRVSLTGLMNWV